MKVEDHIVFAKIKWLMVFRVILVTFLLGMPLLLKLDYLNNGALLSTFNFLIGLTYFLTILYAISLKRVHHPIVFVGIQLTGDLLFVTALVTVTGGIESPFPFLYVMTIVSASIFFHQMGGILSAASTTLCLGTVMNLQYAQVIPFAGPLSASKEVLFMFFLYMVTFFTVGGLSGRLSERLHKKEVDFLDLRVFHENIVQGIPSGIITTDLTGRITTFNQAAEQITQYAASEAVGSILWEFLGWGEMKNRYRDLVLAGTAQRFEGEIRNKKGEQCLLGITLSSLRNDRRSPIGVIAIFQDLTPLKHLEEEMRNKDRLAMIGEMAAGMAHEIRNPLTSLSGSIQLLKGVLNLEGENRQLMEIAHQEAIRLNSIITQFLLYAKPVPASRQWNDIHVILSETVQLLKNAPDPVSHVEVRLVTSSSPLMLFMDSNQMRQVFWNLSVNAVQAMPQGGVLTISTGRVVSRKKMPYVGGDRDLIEVIFKDTGTGIRKEDLPKIFYPFFTTKDSGSGLGLPIVQRVVEEHFGKIEVESGASGTTFRIYLPIDVSAGRAQDAFASSAKNTDVILHKNSPVVSVFDPASPYRRM